VKALKGSRLAAGDEGELVIFNDTIEGNKQPDVKLTSPTDAFGWMRGGERDNVSTYLEYPCFVIPFYWRKATRRVHL
jgi:hypothetical protein